MHITENEGGYYGCPKCQANDGYINHGTHHWFVCTKCKVKWYHGSRLFSSWQHDTVEEQATDLRIFNEYETVEPVFID
jgi:ribosomal protein L37AE/L43A